MQTSCGTPGYVAPEIVKQKKYGPEVDVWSLGVVLYIMLCGFPPFFHPERKELFEIIKKAKYDFPSPWWDAVSPEAKDLIKRMLTKNPEKRATPEEILAHPWIASGKASTATIDLASRLQLLQAKAKLRKGIQTIIAIQRFITALQREGGEIVIGGI